MILARPYVIGDARLIDVQSEQSFEARAGGSEIDVQAARGGAYTIVRDGRPVACGGVFAVWDGMAWAWGLAGKLDTELARVIKRQVRKAMAEIEPPLRRVEATARVDFPSAHRFLTFLGFSPLVVLRKYGPDGEDHWLFEWVEIEP